MRPYPFVFALVVFLSASAAGALELGLSQVSLNVGAIEHFYRDNPETPDIYTAFPELQVRGPFLTSYFHWVLGWGGWDDGVTGPFTEANDITYSFRSQIFSARLMFRPRETGENWPLPIGIFAGYSHHLVHAEYVGGTDVMGEIGRDTRRNSNTFEFGLNAEVPLRGAFVLRGEVRQYAPFSGDTFEAPQKSRRAYTIGIGYAL